ncbi:MAG: DUF2252 family protein [Minicystis sp.]
MGKQEALDRLIAAFAVNDAATARASDDGRERVKKKYKKLQESPYKLFRATNPVFIADLESMPAFGQTCAHEISGPLIGDAHPENLGAVGASAASAQMDFTDFDVVAEGPLLRDLARAACGLSIAIDLKDDDHEDHNHDEGHGHDKPPPVLADAPSDKALSRVRLLSTAWTARILTGQRGQPDPAELAEHFATVDTRLTEQPFPDSKYTPKERPPLEGFDAALADYTNTTPSLRGARLINYWQIQGKGASSYCVTRIVLHLELEGGAERGVEWKPQSDASNVITAFRERRNPSTIDPLLGLISLNGVDHVAQRWTFGGQKVDAEQLHQDKLADAVARMLAVRIADVHRRLTPAILARLRVQSAGEIADQLVDLVRAYYPILREEWRAFTDLKPEELARRVAG